MNRLNNPTLGMVKRSLESIADSDPTELPPLKAVQTLRDAGFGEIRVNDRVIREVETATGRPSHGEMRSDDHISDYVVVFSAGEKCPECGGVTRIYEHHAYHHIAGSSSERCHNAGCEHSFHEEEWG